MDSEIGNRQNLSLIQDIYNSNDNDIRQRIRSALRRSFFLILSAMSVQLILFVLLIIYYKDWYDGPYLILKIITTILFFILTFNFTFSISKNYCHDRENIFENIIDDQLEIKHKDTIKGSLRKILRKNHRVIEFNKDEWNAFHSNDSNEKHTNDSDCAICFEKVLKNEEKTYIELSCCKKNYCLDCLIEWIDKDFNKNNNCPLCRKQII